MKVYIEKDDKKKELKFRGTLRELLNRLKINPGSVIVVKDKKIIHNDDNISDSDKIRILEVSMGG